MKIKNHRLMINDQEAVPYRPSPNKGGHIDPHEYLVMHFTAGASAESSINWLTNPAARASAHLVIGRDGGVTQLVPFDQRAWHAGRSEWANRVGLNSYSIGIELDNAGQLHRQGARWVTAFGRVIADDDVVIARHKNGGPEIGWHAFTERQLETAAEVAVLLVEKYRLLDVVGHDDIAPGRKTDPGPAFPMRSFQARVMGRRGDEVYRTTTALNIRSGPGTEHATLPGSPLPDGTQVIVLNSQGLWQFVDVLSPVNGEMDLQGWVHGRYLAPA
jgi:N-acetylmuramoyl-L-alanine amidase